VFEQRWCDMLHILNPPSDVGVVSAD
jgi:hypothetical protein